MGLLDAFRKKKVELTEDQKKWNRIWELWADGGADAPYAELMTYQSEVNNGGHAQYFDNVENTADLQNEMSVLETILPENLRQNLQKAYRAYTVSDADERTDEIMEECDSMFYENEEMINRLLEEYADSLR